MRGRRATYTLMGFVISVLLLHGCSSGGGSENSGTTNVQTRIEGTVFDAVNGEPIRDAVVRTDPPSEEVSTNALGEFSVTDALNGSGNVQVIVEHFAYEAVQTTVGVSAGMATQLDVPMQNSAIGLHASATLFNFAPDTNRKTLRLSSNTQNTGYSVFVSDPWLTVTPSQGIIVNRESVLLQMYLDQEKLPTRLPAESEIVINADNGTRELVITIVIEGPDNDDPVTDLHARQNDCRRSDVLRVGLEDPDSPLVQFLPSVVLPGDEGPRLLEINNPFLIDSLVVRELGMLTLTHSEGGPDKTSLELFELSKENIVNTVAFNRGVSVDNLRASLDWALTPGVYCYYLGGTDANFDQSYRLQIDIGFVPAQ